MISPFLFHTRPWAAITAFVHLLFPLSMQTKREHFKKIVSISTIPQEVLKSGLCALKEALFLHRIARMLVFSSAKLVLLSMPKTGSTAYEAALAPHASMVVNAPPELKHAPVFRYNRFFRPMLEKFVGEGLTVVAVMREPLDWLGSWYRYRQRDSLKSHPNSTQGISYDDFVQAYMMGKKPAFAQVGSQAKFLEVQPSGAAVTHLFRYDRQDEYVTFLQNRLGVEIETQRMNASPATKLSLSDATREKFLRKCAPEYRIWASIGAGGAYTPLDREETRGL